METRRPARKDLRVLDRVDIGRTIEVPNASVDGIADELESKRCLGKLAVVAEAQAPALDTSPATLTFVTMDGRCLSRLPTNDQELEQLRLVDQVARVAIVTEARIGLQRGRLDERFLKISMNAV